jgi:hypothetical protein
LSKHFGKALTQSYQIPRLSAITLQQGVGFPVTAGFLPAGISSRLTLTLLEKDQKRNYSVNIVQVTFQKKLILSFA